MDIQVGKKVYMEPVGNYVRQGYKIKEGIITKIGKKYFYINDDKFDILTLKNINEHNAKWILYESMQEISDKKEARQLVKEIGEFFRWYEPGMKLTLEELREISAIINKEKKE